MGKDFILKILPQYKTHALGSVVMNYDVHFESSTVFGTVELVFVNKRKKIRFGATAQAVERRRQVREKAGKYVL